MKELEDSTWFPNTLRNFQTEFIGFVVTKFNMYGAFVHYINGLLLPVKPMADLCSGSGEPAISIFKKSSCFSSLKLSDKYPILLKSRDELLIYETKPMDVLNMEFKYGNCYTMFNALHHFSDKDKLRKIQASGSNAFFVEILEPRISCFLKVLFTTTLGSLLLTPLIQPFSIKRLFYTYILPLSIFAITIDGVLSVLKSHSLKRYQTLFAGSESAIDVFQLKSSLSPITIIQIHPEI